MQLDLFEVPREPEPKPQFIEPNPAAAPTVFNFGGRALRIARAYGTDSAAPIIVEELSDRFTLKGQYALWSRQGVTREMEKQ